MVNSQETVSAEKTVEKNWFSKHVDTVIVLGGILSAVIWMQGKFSHTDERINEVTTRVAVVNHEIVTLKNDLAQLKVDVSQLKLDMSTVKTVLIMKNIMPQELAAHVEERK